MNKVAFASFIGTAIEFYDFYIYGTAAALIFPQVFFPNLPPAMATISSLATFAVAFLARPIGAASAPPVADRRSPPFSTSTATATFGDFAGANAMYHAWGGV